MWGELTRLERPRKGNEERLFCVTAATIRYGRGLGFAVSGKCGEARAELDEMNRIMEIVEEERRYLHNNKSIEMLKVEREKLRGEIYYFEGQKDKAFEILRGAVEMDDGLKYDEPWGVMSPGEAKKAVERGSSATSESNRKKGFRRVTRMVAAIAPSD